MINIFIQKNEPKVINTESLISGTANVVYVKFNLSEHWDGLLKTAVFTNGQQTITLLDTHWKTGNVCAIPGEVLDTAGKVVRVGLRGTQSNNTVLVTPMFSIGKVQPGADPMDDQNTDPALPIWEQLREDINKRSYSCSTWMEKFVKSDSVGTTIRVHLSHPENIPEGAVLYLYRCIRNRGARAHWVHPVDWRNEPEHGQHRWGYGLLQDTAAYPPVPEWMPQHGFLQTEFYITDEDRKLGYIDIDLGTYLLPLLKPTDKELEWKELGFIGLQGNGQENCHLLRFRICKYGQPIDVLGDTLRIGFRGNLTERLLFENRKLATAWLYTSIK